MGKFKGERLVFEVTWPRYLKIKTSTFNLVQKGDPIRLINANALLSLMHMVHCKVYILTELMNTLVTEIQTSIYLYGKYRHRA